MACSTRKSLQGICFKSCLADISLTTKDRQEDTNSQTSCSNLSIPKMYLLDNEWFDSTQYRIRNNPDQSNHSLYTLYFLSSLRLTLPSDVSLSSLSTVTLSTDI